MTDQVEIIREEIDRYEARNQEELEAFRMRFISRKSVVSELFGSMKEVPAEQRKAFGIALNELKEAAQSKFQELIKTLQNGVKKADTHPVDLTLPSADSALGSVHPLSATKMKMIQVLGRIGFNVSEGPEIENDWYNFSALNFPENHPAREMQDTFFITKDPDILLRTHTSNVQIRTMENQAPPIRTLSIGRVFRNEAISARAHCIFHQVEGLYVDKNVSIKNLKETLYYFAKEMFSKETKVRFRPSYFPFTEPSAEFDISCQICEGSGCAVCKHTGWVEIGGSGMVDPNVLENCNIDSKTYTGFAFGLGLERTAMLKYRINDLRLFTENDIRFLQQFQKL